MQRILDRLPGHQRSASGWEARCPAHDDRRASLSIARGADGRALLNCHAGCAPTAICQALGLGLADLFPPRSGRAPRGTGQIVATYDYRAADGALLFQVVRFEPKDFRQRVPTPDGGWRWSLGETPRVLYRLPELLAADPAQPVHVAEGEKDVHALESLGLVATCNPGGAGKWARLASDDALVGRTVVILADADEAGRKHAADVARRLHGRTATVRILELPQKDPADWIAAGGTAEQLAALVAATPPYAGPPDEIAADQFELGQPHAQTGRIVLSVDRTRPTAEAFVRAFYAHPEGLRLRCYAGLLLAWDGSRYAEVEDNAFRQRLLDWLHAAQRVVYDARRDVFLLRDFPANPRTVVGALDTLRAFTHLSAAQPCPSWLTGAERQSPPHELLACHSTLLHLPTLRTQPATPAYFTTTALDFDHDAQAHSPDRWLEFLGQLFEDDLQAWDLLQDWFGYCLTPDTSQQKMLLIVGPKRSGKGTLARVLTALVGPGNVCNPTTAALAGPFGLQPLIGKSLAIVADARFSGEGIQTVVERLLCISGEDGITIDRKHTTSVTLRLPTRFVFLTNELPRLSDVSGAIASRFLVLRLHESFYDKEDLDLTHRLLTELPGILNWAIAGWQRLRQRRRFLQPASSEAAIREIEDLSSPVGAFVRDCCDVGPDGGVWLDDLYHAWQEWCQRDGRVAVSTRQHFCRDLFTVVPHLVARRGTHNVRYYRGIALKQGDLWLDQP